jgi:transgelin
MPFVQMENISHFLHACEMPPLNLPSHDRFLTVDLYDSKDPAQVLQCIGAFSRRANAINPSRFPQTIGAKSKGSAMSPQLSGSSQGGYGRAPGSGNRERALSNNSDTSATTFNPLAKASYSGLVNPSSLARGGLASPGPVSSWSKKDDESKTAPAWNIHQYGYMGGASQGNQGVAFGARRQITSAAPNVPSLAEKERRRQEEAAEEERLRLQAEHLARQRRAEQEAEEERARAEEERMWEEETRRMREKERKDAEEEKRRWDEEQRRWKEEEDARVKEEKELEARLAAERTKTRAVSDARLNGQFLSQYQANQNQPNKAAPDSAHTTSESKRIQDLERQLQEAKEREMQYERERQARTQQFSKQATVPARPVSPPAPSLPVRPTAVTARPVSPPMPSLPPRPAAPSASHEDDWQESERDFLRKEWQSQQDEADGPPPPKPPRPTLVESSVQSNSSRPLPDPSTYTPSLNRIDRFLSSNPAPPPAQTASHRPSDYSTTTEVDLENQRRKESQAKTKAGGWASKSLLEREMERERERQREWEEGQKQTVAAVRDKDEGTGPGQSWDVHQYGFMGGDNQNRGGPGLGVGGARRQIIGPRPPP